MSILHAFVRQRTHDLIRLQYVLKSKQSQTSKQLNSLPVKCPSRGDILVAGIDSLRRDL
jgi:hypothetical protein